MPRFAGGTALLVASYRLDAVYVEGKPPDEEGRRLFPVKGALEGVVIRTC